MTFGPHVKPEKDLPSDSRERRESLSLCEKIGMRKILLLLVMLVAIFSSLGLRSRGPSEFRLAFWHTGKEQAELTGVELNQTAPSPTPTTSTPAVAPATPPAVSYPYPPPPTSSPSPVTPTGEGPILTLVILVVVLAAAALLALRRR